jgi:hypothetical protein
LIAASFLVAVLLNRSAHEEARPAKAIPAPPARICEDSAPRAAGVTSASSVDAQPCKRLPTEAVER